MDQDRFEAVLDALVERLTNEVRANADLHIPSVFEGRVRTDLQELLRADGVTPDLNTSPGFP